MKIFVSTKKNRTYKMITKRILVEGKVIVLPCGYDTKIVYHGDMKIWFNENFQIPNKYRFFWIKNIK